MSAFMAMTVQVDQCSSRLFVNGTFIRPSTAGFSAVAHISFDLNTIPYSLALCQCKNRQVPLAKIINWVIQLAISPKINFNLCVDGFGI